MNSKFITLNLLYISYLAFLYINKLVYFLLISFNIIVYTEFKRYKDDQRQNHNNIIIIHN